MSDVHSKSTRPEWANRALASEFEPLPRIGVVQSVRRYWYLVLVPIVVFVAAAAVAAEKRTPRYTAEARLMVGRLNMSTPGAVAGFAQAAQDLASAYPLAIDATGVVGPLARQFHTTPAQIRNEISSSQVPSSPIVRVFATGSSPRQAVSLANAAGNQLVSFLGTFNQDNPDVARLLQEDSAAQVGYQRDLAGLQAASKQTGPLSPQGQKLAAAVNVDKLVTTSLGNDYQIALQTGTVTSLLAPLQFADTATSDKRSTLQIALFAALVTGLLAGLGLATLRANMLARRALTAPSWEPEPDGGVSAGDPSPAVEQLHVPTVPEAAGNGAHAPDHPPAAGG